MPQFKKEGRGFKMKGWSPFTKLKDETGPAKNQKTAQYGSYDELLKSDRYKRNQKSKKYARYTYWDRSGDKPKVYTLEKNTEFKPKGKNS